MMKDALQTRMNFEMGVTEAMLAFAEQLRPEHVCSVPETRRELTTEGGLDVAGRGGAHSRGGGAVARLRCGSLAVHRCRSAADRGSCPAGAPAIELHTGRYADAHSVAERACELARIRDGVEVGLSHGLIVNAGHGLHYHNAEAIAAIRGVNELNIGHAIVAHALFVGFKQAVKEMKHLILSAAARG